MAGTTHEEQVPTFAARVRTSETFLVFAVLIVALASAMSARTPALQAPPDDGKREFIVSGCLLRNGYAGYALDDSRVIAIDGKRLPDPAPASAPAMPKKWVLDGGGNLGPRAGEKVEVTGRTDWQPPSAQPSPDEPPDRLPHLEVKAVKTVAPSCT
jgi:hypothetical protein